MNRIKQYSRRLWIITLALSFMRTQAAYLATCTHSAPHTKV